MTMSTGSSSDIQWNSSGREHGQISREIGDTAHDAGGLVLERDAYEISEYSGQRDYDGDASNGSRFDRSDIPKGQQDRWKRLWMWNEGASPSYEDGDGLESQISNPSDTTGRRAHQDKLETVERIAAKFSVPQATINEARTLASAVDATGHSLQKVAIGAIVVANDRHIAEKVRRSEANSTVVEALHGDVSDSEISTALNLLEDPEALSHLFEREDAEALSHLFERRLKGRDDIAEYVEDCGFKISNAMAVFYDE